MARKKARLNDSNNPLSPTEQVLAGLEQVSQSSRISDKLSIDSDKTSPTIPHNFSASQPANNITSQKPNKLTNQVAEQPTSKNFSPPEIQTTINSNTSNSFEVEQVPVTLHESQQNTEPENPSQKLPQKQNSQKKEPSSLSGKDNNQTSSAFNLRKATFKIDSQILDQLDRYHLELQLQLGKRNAPYKETIVELAIKNILAEVESNPKQLLQQLHQQQQLRE